MSEDRCAASASAVARACLADLRVGRSEEGVDEEWVAEAGIGEGRVIVMLFVWMSWPGKCASGPKGILPRYRSVSHHMCAASHSV